MDTTFVSHHETVSWMPKPVREVVVIIVTVVITVIAANIVLLCYRHCDQFFTDDHIPYFADGETETELK